jgi:hypothetical protein
MTESLVAQILEAHPRVGRVDLRSLLKWYVQLPPREREALRIWAEDVPDPRKPLSNLEIFAIHRVRHGESAKK